MRALAAGIASALLTLALGERSADASNACVDAYERAQEQRQAHHLVRAREALRVCADASCPAVTIKDCRTWLDEVEHALPSVVVAVRDDQGVDVPDARIFIDDQPASKEPQQLDPGPHRARCETALGARAVLDVVVQEREKDRVIVCVPKPPEVPSGRRFVPGVIAAGAVAVVAVGIWAGAGIRGIEDRSSLLHSCNPSTCSASQVSRVRTELAVADVGLGFTLASVAVGGILLIVGRPGAQQTTGLVVPSPLPRGMALGWVTTF